MKQTETKSEIFGAFKSSSFFYFFHLNFQKINGLNIKKCKEIIILFFSVNPQNFLFIIYKIKTMNKIQNLAIYIEKVKKMKMHCMV